MAKKRSNKSSEDYWRERETANRAKGIKDVKRISSDLKDVYIRMMQEAQRDIEAFYQRYADAEGISLAEARKRASQLDIAAYAARAKRYVASKDLSDEANAEMRLYNMTMRVNRLELLRAEIGLALVDGFEDMAGIFDRELLKKSMDEFERLSGILGMTLQDPVSKARQIVDASFHNATWSERLWKYQDSLKTEIGRQLTSGLIAGRSSEDMARQIRNVFGVSLGNAVRLMSTEFRRVQTDAAKASYEANGNEEYEFMAVGPRPCPICQDLNGQIFKVSEMMPGRNAPPMHPRCHCCTSPVAARERALISGGVSKDEGELFHTYSDPMREKLGSAYSSHSEEVEIIKKDLQRMGVEIIERGRGMNYGPSPSPGRPGVLSIDPKASYSAWLHEYKHAKDDEASGWKGIIALMDTEAAIKWEDAAYNVEIEFARKMGYNKIAHRLEWLKGERRRELRGKKKRREENS